VNDRSHGVLCCFCAWERGRFPCPQTTECPVDLPFTYTSFGHYMITVLSTISCSVTSTGSSFIEISFLFLYVDLWSALIFWISQFFSPLSLDNNDSRGRGRPGVARFHDVLLRGTPLLLPPVREPRWELSASQQRAPDARASMRAEIGQSSRLRHIPKRGTARAGITVGQSPPKSGIASNSLQRRRCRRRPCTSQKVGVKPATPL